MRRNSCTVVALAGPAPAEVLAAVGRSMNVTLIRPEKPERPGEPGDSRKSGEPGRDGIALAAAALQRAARATSAYAVVAADPLAAVAASWRAMWDVARLQGPAGFEQDAVRAVAAWRSGQFELPDYYLVLAAAPSAAAPSAAAPSAAASAAPGPHAPGHATVGPDAAAAPDPDFHLGPLRAVRPHRVVLVAATEPAEQAAGVLQALGSLRHGPWWPGLDEVMDTARRFYPGSLAEGSGALAASPR